jgi:hypothetical protein
MGERPEAKAEMIKAIETLEEIKGFLENLRSKMG